MVLKVFVDTYPEVQIIATGSSYFELANRIGEPLVGRAWDFFLAPLAFAEIFYDTHEQQATRQLEELLIYGSFPAVVTSPSKDKIATLGQIANNYLYKDIFTYEQIRKPKILEDLLKLLALQLGNEVSVTELSNNLQIGRPTVERYLQLLEKTFVIKRLYTLKRNRRDEMRSAFKIYFYDTGVRNYLINNFNPASLRNDIGFLFENYFIMERIKYHHQTSGILPPMYFWRTYKQMEIDYIEEHNGILQAFECKWGNKKVSFGEFQKSYPASETHVVHRENIGEFLK
jgi:predicted AAA+ superfamily ATPase